MITMISPYYDSSFSFCENKKIRGEWILRDTPGEVHTNN